MNGWSEAVRRRAGNRCEYCRLPQGAFPRGFHIEHIVARQHGGPTRLDNLAFACWSCNLKKGPVWDQFPSRRCARNAVQHVQNTFQEPQDWIADCWLEATARNRCPIQTLSLAPLVRLHFASQDLVHIRLVLPASPSKPVEDVGIHAKAHQLLDWPIKTADLNVGRLRLSFRRIGKVDLRIRTIRQPL